MYGFETKLEKKQFPSRKQRQVYDDLIVDSLSKVPFNDYRKLLVLTDDEVNTILKTPNARRTGEMPYHHLKDYQDSFEDIDKFRETHWAKEDCIFDVVLMHDNSDGVFSTFAYWLWRTENGSKNLDTFIVLTSKPEKRGEQTGGATEQAPPSITLSRIWHQLINKRVLVLDLNYSSNIQDWFYEHCKKVLFIDDHSEKGNNKKSKSKQKQEQKPWLFIGQNHSSAAYTHKFFFPQQEIPLIFVYVDNQDRKLHSPFLPYPAPLITYITSHFIKRIHNPQAYDPKKELWGYLLYLMQNPVAMLLAIKTGSNMDEIKDLEKDEAVKHACFGKLHIPNLPSYKVGILNLDHDVLTKVTGKEILTLSKKMGDVLDISILWGQHYNKDKYHITVTKLPERNDIDLVNKVLPLMKKYFLNATGGGHKFQISIMMEQYKNKKDTKELINKMFEKTHCRSLISEINSS